MSLRRLVLAIEYRVESSARACVCVSSARALQSLLAKYHAAPQPVIRFESRSDFQLGDNWRPGEAGK